jgi:hypothetical protein
MLTPEQTKRIEELNTLIAPYLNSMDPSMAAYLLRCQPEVEKYDLSTLVWLLAGGEYGCHKNDVIGVIELIEKHMENENE